jgi:hypothetical protein
MVTTRGDELANLGDLGGLGVALDGMGTLQPFQGLYLTVLKNYRTFFKRKPALEGAEEWLQESAANGFGVRESTPEWRATQNNTANSHVNEISI